MTQDAPRAATPTPSSRRTLKRQTSAIHASFNDEVAGSKRKRVTRTNADGDDAQPGNADDEEQPPSASRPRTASKVTNAFLREEVATLQSRLDSLADAADADRAVIPGANARITESIANTEQRILEQVALTTRAQLATQSAIVESSHISLLAQINDRFVDLAQKLDEVGEQAINSALQATRALNTEAHNQHAPELGITPGSHVTTAPSMPLLAAHLNGPSATGTELDLPDALRDAEMLAPFPASTPCAPPGPPNSQPIVQMESLQYVLPAPAHAPAPSRSGTAPHNPSPARVSAAPAARTPASATATFAHPAPLPPPAHSVPGLPPPAAAVAPAPAAPSPALATPSGAGDVMLGPLGWTSANVRGQVFDVADLVFRRNIQRCPRVPSAVGHFSIRHYIPSSHPIREPVNPLV